jgi:hypothetical protein
MTTIVQEVYDALKKAGVDDDLARAAAHAVIDIEEKEHLATKADLNELRLATKAELSELTAELIKWNVGAIFAANAVFYGLLKLFPGSLR